MKARYTIATITTEDVQDIVKVEALRARGISHKEIYRTGLNTIIKDREIELPEAKTE